MTGWRGLRIARDMKKGGPRKRGRPSLFSFVDSAIVRMDRPKHPGRSPAPVASS
ncbi:hypothetical protein [Burkholderia thailandensis]|uniref:Uncharacterized protein n=2 Tax=Burkholderia thailandensis TaxID=57975 RepID=A0AAW9D0T1_BURTH|nr:hypothetical protein [Burkholderia thailandensis]ABC38543.1 hypothetical protein BTH_I1557 [Burkholderia thailandensis E264]MBS2127608.1 hypothetical protein [Burkholderia thailandensis]MCS3390978.1 hypothetical protein [Burkholderia thailandensis]MCS3397743.1 hypothetical protein [Burkholderia thailandensis]MCS6423584.1 hypothetical protein [Burkholderia thailandensis]